MAAVTRAHALVGGTIAICVAVAATILMASGNDDASQTFVAQDGSTALLIAWTRVGDDVSGSMTRAQLVVPEPSRFVDARLASEVPREVKRNSRPFTGTSSGDSVRLALADGQLGSRVNGRLDGDALTLMLTGDNGPRTLRLTTGTRREFDTAVQHMRATETRRARLARATRERADATAGIAIVRVATAYERALDPDSPDDPCRYMTAAARADVVADASSGAPTGGCKAIVRYYESRANGSARPRDLGAATVELGAPVRVPAPPGSFRPSQVDGAEVRFANAIQPLPRRSRHGPRPLAYREIPIAHGPTAARADRIGVAPALRQSVTTQTQSWRRRACRPERS